MKKPDLILISLPFLLTALLVSVGYQVLVNQTPQASINTAQSESNIEIIEDGSISPTLPSVSLPTTTSGAIHPIPNNQEQLAQLLKLSIDQKASVIHFSLPVTLGDDNSFTLTDAQLSSEENIIRWTKKSISTAHENNLHVILAITLNATKVISNPQDFALKYQAFIQKWASLAQETGASYLSPGITLGHPLYSQISETQFNRIAQTIQAGVRQKYAGRIGLGFCCSITESVSARGYSYLTLIPTPEVTQEDLVPIAQSIAQTSNFTQILIYDRIAQRITSISP